MIDVDQITGFYPIELQSRRKDILREYLQCLLLQIIFEHPISKKLSFLGDTCLRLVHNTQRFSEDLDFDNDDVSENEIMELKKFIDTKIRDYGYTIESTLKGKNAYRILIQFKDILYTQKLSGYKEEKLTIQVDTQAQNFKFEKQSYILNRLGFFSDILITPIEIILAQKCFTILNRPRSKGRDYYDVVFLLGKNIQPNLKYLDQKMKTNSLGELKIQLLEHWSRLNPEEQVRDVRGFLFNQNDYKMISHFGQIIKQLDW